MNSTGQEKSQITLGRAIIPLVVLMLLLSMNVFTFGDNANYGPNQFALLIAAAVGVVVAIRSGLTWNQLEGDVFNSIRVALPAILILLLIGALIGTWMFSGIVPAMIYYGLSFLNPSIFLVASCLICIVVSLATGSSWTTVGTVGVALIAIGGALGFETGLVAGSIISGAYFGDKMSPLSDTTNLAPAVSGTDLFTHIRYMSYTTLVSIIITLLIFLFIGLGTDSSANIEQIQSIRNGISNTFWISPWLFTIPLIVIGLIVLKMPAVPSIFIGVILGIVAMFVFQSENIQPLIDWLKTGQWGSDSNWQVHMSNNAYSIPLYVSILLPLIVLVLGWKKILSFRVSAILLLIYASAVVSYIKYAVGFDALLTDLKYFAFIQKAIIQVSMSEVAYSTGVDQVDDLLGTSGMVGMLNTIWLIFCAMIFGGVMEKSGMLSRITISLLKKVHSDFQLIGTTAGTCIFFNVTASDQYLAIVVPGRMFASEYEKRGLAPENLSRTLEDSGTVTSALVPWNTCGAYHSETLKTATLDYLPFAFFNWLSPVVTVLFAALRIKIRKKAKKKENK